MRKPYIPKNALPSNDMGVYDDPKEYARPAGSSARTQVVQEVKDKIIRKNPDQYKALVEPGGALKHKARKG